MKRNALEKAALPTAPADFNQTSIWENDDEMILKLMYIPTAKPQLHELETEQ